MRVLSLILLIVLVGGCMNPSAVPAFAQGRLVHPAYAEIVGEPSEITAIKEQALRQGWGVDCEGGVGAELTLRLRFPPGTPHRAIDDFLGAEAFLTQPRGRKVQMIYHGMARSAGCITLP